MVQGAALLPDHSYLNGFNGARSTDARTPRAGRGTATTYGDFKIVNNFLKFGEYIVWRKRRHCEPDGHRVNLGRPGRLANACPRGEDARPFGRKFRVRGVGSHRDVVLVITLFEVGRRLQMTACLRSRVSPHFALSIAEDRCSRQSLESASQETAFHRFQCNNRPWEALPGRPYRQTSPCRLFRSTRFRRLEVP